MQILIIDDDPVNNFIIRENIKKLNDQIEVVEKSSLIEGICFLKNSLSKKNPPDIIFCDYNLPPYTGKDFSRIANRFFNNKLNHVKIYLLSAAVDQYLKNSLQGYEFIDGIYDKSYFDRNLPDIINNN